MPEWDGDPRGCWVRGAPPGWRADPPRDFIPMKRFSTMSMRPTPCLPLWGEWVTGATCSQPQAWPQRPPTQLLQFGHIRAVPTPEPRAGCQAPSQTSSGLENI